MQLTDGKGHLTLHMYWPPPPMLQSLLATEPVSPLRDPPRKPVFGLDLDELFERDSSAVPLIVYQCIVAVDLFGIDSKDIYRHSGTPSNVDKMRAMFDTGMSGIII